MSMKIDIIEKQHRARVANDPEFDELVRYAKKLEEDRDELIYKNNKTYAWGSRLYDALQPVARFDMNADIPSLEFYTKLADAVRETQRLANGGAR